MKKLLALISLLLWAVDVSATLREDPVASLPTAPVAGTTRIVTDGVDEADCLIGGGNKAVLCTFDGNSWVAGGGGGSAQGLQANFLAENTITSATSANPMEVTNGTQGVQLYGSATDGGVIKPFPLGDSLWRIWPNFNGCIRDMEAAVNMICLDPDSPSPNPMYQFQQGYKPLLSFPVPLEPRGAVTAASESLTTNVPKQRYMTVTDSNTDAVDFSFVVTARMAGATTMTFRLIGVSTNASPSGNIDFDCAAYTYTPGTDTIAAHSTTGEVTATLTPATQYRPVAVTTAAHPINGGALVEGDLVLGSCEVDANATTSAQMTYFRLYDNINISLSINSWSD